MQNRTPDGKSFQEVIEAALEGQAANNAEGAVEAAGCTMGEVLDTHHPHLPGRVFVRFITSERKVQEHWLQAERHLRLRKGDRVIMTLPTGWKQWVVTGALGRRSLFSSGHGAPVMLENSAACQARVARFRRHMACLS